MVAVSEERLRACFHYVRVLSLLEELNIAATQITTIGVAVEDAAGERDAEPVTFGGAGFTLIDDLHLESTALTARSRSVLAEEPPLSRLVVARIEGHGSCPGLKVDARGVIVVLELARGLCLAEILTPAY